MLAFLGTAFSGWIVVFGVLAAAAIGLAVRTAVATGPGTMRLHYVLGLSVPAVAFVHAWIPMATGRAGSFARIGLWLALFALVLLFVQVVLGLNLRRLFPAPTALKRVHLGVMIAMAALIVSHVALDMA